MAQINTINKKLLMDFIDYNAQDGKQSGYLLVNKGNYKSNSTYFNETPKKGEETLIKLRFTQERISDRNLETQVEQYLRSVEDKI